jgi:hypothetical protein
MLGGLPRLGSVPRRRALLLNGVLLRGAFLLDLCRGWRRRPRLDSVRLCRGRRGYVWRCRARLSRWRLSRALRKRMLLHRTHLSSWRLRRPPRNRMLLGRTRLSGWRLSWPPRHRMLLGRTRLSGRRLSRPPRNRMLPRRVRRDCALPSGWLLFCRSCRRAMRRDDPRSGKFAGSGGGGNRRTALVHRGQLGMVGAGCLLMLDLYRGWRDPMLV